VSPELQARVEALIAEHGEEAVGRALSLAPMLGPELRTTSAASAQAAGTFWDGGIPVAMLWQLRPKAQRAGERVEIRVLTGEIDLKLGLS
jgi:hypothetical protein